MTLFETKPGVAVALPDANFETVPMRVALDGWDKGSYLRYASILTGVRMQRRERFQEMSTFGDLVYMFSFGSAVGQMVMHGVTFNRNCVSSIGVSGQSNLRGIVAINDYYDAANISNREQPLTVQIGHGSLLQFPAFLVGLDAGIDNSEEMIGSFAMTVRLMPKRRR